MSGNVNFCWNEVMYIYPDHREWFISDFELETNLSVVHDILSQYRMEEHETHTLAKMDENGFFLYNVLKPYRLGDAIKFFYDFDMEQEKLVKMTDIIIALTE